MADENIILRVGIDDNQLRKSEQAIVSARIEIDKLKEANKELADQGEKNSVEFVRNQVAIKDLSNTVRENERVLGANAKMSRSASGSIAELRETVKTLQAEYVGLSKEERENEKVGGALQKQIAAQNEELKDLEKNIGITGRNVGNYASDIIAAADGTGLFTKAQQALKTVTDLTSGALKGSTGAAQGFGLSLKALGIGLLLALIVPLISYLSRFQSGIDAVSRVMAGLGTFTNVVLDALSTLGEQIIDAIIPTFKALFDVVAGLVTLDFDRVKAGFAGIGEAVSGIQPINLLELGAAAIKAGADAAKLEGEMQELIRAEKQLDLERANSRKTVAQLKKDADDITKSLEERAKAAERAAGIEIAQEQKAIALQQERIRILKAQNELSSSSDADINRVIDAEIRLAELQEQSATRQTELQNKQNSIRKEQETLYTNDFVKQLQARTKASQDEAKKQVEAQKTAFANGEISFREYQDSLSEIEAVSLAFRRELALSELALLEQDQRVNAEKRVDIETELNNQLREIEAAENELSFTNRKAFLARQKELANERISDRESELNLQNALEQKALAEQLANDEITRFEYDARLAAIQGENLEERKELLRANLADMLALEDLDARQRVELERSTAEEIASIDAELANQKARNADLVAQSRIQAEQAVLKAAIDVFGKTSAAGKIAATFQATIDTFRAANLALATIPPPFGQIVAAASVASGLANVAKINSTSTPSAPQASAGPAQRPAPRTVFKMAEGGAVGEIGGASHNAGGVDLALNGQTVANVERGEGLFVMKNTAFQALKNLSAFNQAFGGRSWGGPSVSHLADGGAVSRSAAPRLDRQSLLNAQESFQASIRGLQVVTKITDIERVRGEVLRSEVRGDL